MAETVTYAHLVAIMSIIKRCFQVLNETWANVDQMDGKSFSSKFVNRSFDFGFDTVRIGSNGMRNRDTLFLKFNSSSGQFEVRSLFAVA